jgi:hypothetical protein
MAAIDNIACRINQCERERSLEMDAAEPSDGRLTERGF